MQYLSEINFKEEFEQNALPYLTKVKKSGQIPFAVKNNNSIYSQGFYHYDSYIPDNPKAVILCSHGLGESSLKQREMIYYFLQNHFIVYAPDHRGHGYSYSGAGDRMVHIEHFDDYAEDMKALVDSVIKPNHKDLPLYLYAHSMGGGIGTRVLEKYPDTFQRAVLTAPMLGINTGGIPTGIALFISRIMVFFGKGASFGAGQHAFDPKAETFENSGSSSSNRFQYYADIKITDPIYRIGGTSYNWIKESLIACRKNTDSKNCAKIKIPVLVCLAQKDAYVSADAIHTFVNNVPSATLKEYDCKHEIFNANDDLQRQYVADILDFFDKQ